MVTLKEIAQKCNVSIATVSNILNGKSNFSEETKNKILQVIQETGYKPNYMARTLRARKTNTIGLIVDDLIDFSAPQIIDGLMGYCESIGYKIVLENIRYYTKLSQLWKNQEEFRKAVDQAVQEMVAIKVDGIIYIASHSRNMDCIPKNLDVPVVISYAYSEEGIPSVLFDDVGAAFELTEYLINKGHSKIALIMGQEQSLHTQRRFEGFEKALKVHNLPLDKSVCFYGNWDESSGFDACNALLESNTDVTAIMCFNDVMASGVYKCLQKRNLVPGKDMAVVGFDNRELCGYLVPGLTSMRIPLLEIGAKSAEVLVDLINEKTADLRTIISCELIERDSVNFNLQL